MYTIVVFKTNVNVRLKSLIYLKKIDSIQISGGVERYILCDLSKVNARQNMAISVGSTKGPPGPQW